MQKNRFGSKMWDNPVDHNRNAEWIMTVEKELENVTQQGNINITKEDVTILFGKLEICQIEKEICQIEKRQSLSDYMDSSPGNGKTPR